MSIITQAMNIAVIMTCHNRIGKTLSCLEALERTSVNLPAIHLTIYLTDDGCTDGTAGAILEQKFSMPIHILQGDGNLFWNGGMILAWKAAIDDGGFDGYLWMNDDTTVLPEFWPDLLATDAHCLECYGKQGIYAGSTRDKRTGDFTYGGFNYYNKFLLLDRFVIPDGHSFQSCEAAHGNVTYVSRAVVEKMGVFCEKYIHGGTDHEYTYLAQKAGFPLLVLPHYSAECENDHLGKTRDHTKLSLRERIKVFNSPWGYNMHNTLLFNWHCFPWRVPFVYLTGVIKMLFPKLGYGTYLFFRKLFKEDTQKNNTL